MSTTTTATTNTDATDRANAHSTTVGVTAALPDDAPKSFDEARAHRSERWHAAHGYPVMSQPGDWT